MAIRIRDVFRTTRLRVPSELLLLAVLTTLLCKTAYSASPSLARIDPRGGQRGTEVEFVLSGTRLADAEELLFYSTGFKVTELKAVSNKEVKARVQIAPDCRLGEHALRVRTATGVSDLRSFYVGALPAVAEKEPNSDFTAPQKIPLNVTVSGVVQNEDVDYFAFAAKKGQRVTAEIEGLRLGLTVFDPYVAILNQARFELAASDDTALLRQDSFCQVIVPEDGNYVVEVRESAYGGNGNCLYRLHVGTFPRPTALLPAGGKPGEKLVVSFLGDAGGPMSLEIELPRVSAPEAGLFAEDSGGVAPSPLPVRLAGLENTLEVEPNNDHATATPAKIPGAFCGVLAEKGDVDVYRFAAQKGQTFDIQLHGRRLRSPIDSVLAVYHLGGGRIASNDDSVGPDSYLRFTAPDTKEFAVSVRDHLGAGGRDFAYRIELAAVRPRLTLGIPTVRQNSQERQAIAVPRGNRYATLISASRENFGGDLVLRADGLPQGCTMTCDNMAANLSVLPVLFEAAPDAPVAGTLARLKGQHADPKQGIAGEFHQQVDLVIGSPGQSVYWSHSVDRVAVAVTREVPFLLRIVEPKVPLVRNGAMDIKVVAEPKNGFDAPIRLQMVFDPPGVNSARNVTIDKGKSEASIRLNANNRAQIRSWKIVVNGTANVGSGPAWVSSQLATLRVAEPYLTLALEKASAEQGEEAEIVCKVEHRRPFEGTAKIQLVGLPHKVSSPEVEINKEVRDFAFQVKTDPQSPPGRHRNIFCSVTIIENGEPIVHRSGSTELRIDKPLPPPADAPAKPKAVAKKEPPEPQPKKPQAKRLSRLEKLRLEYLERTKGESSKDSRK